MLCTGVGEYVPQDVQTTYLCFIYYDARTEEERVPTHIGRGCVIWALRDRRRTGVLVKGPPVSRKM